MRTEQEIRARLVEFEDYIRQARAERATDNDLNLEDREFLRVSIAETRARVQELRWMLGEAAT